jgi:DNA modification methylase
MNQILLFKEEKKAGSVLLSKTFSFKRIRNEYWDFKSIPASMGVYGIHPYPAMFHFLIVRQIIKDFSNEGELILDPFMGSGVVAVESLINNRNFIGFDINPLALLISKVRTAPISLRQFQEALAFIELGYKQNNPEPIEFYNINYWFDRDVIDQLSKLRKAIFTIEDNKVRDFFKIVFSEVVRKVSNTEYNEFKLLKKKNSTKNNLDVINVFKNVGQKNIGLLIDFYSRFPRNDIKLVLENQNILDASSLIDDESIDIVITSPPYGDSKTTVAYGQFSRLSLQWLGFTENVDKASLGSKPKNIIMDLPSTLLYELLEKISSKDEKRAKEVYSFYKDLYEAIEVISNKVKMNGHVCFVVGNRRVKNEELPTDKISADFFENLGFQHQKTIVRAISNKRMPIQNAPSNIRGEKDFTMRYEYIVILKKANSRR